MVDSIFPELNPTLKFRLGNDLFRLLKEKYHALEYVGFADRVKEILQKYGIKFKQTKPGNKVTIEINDKEQIENALKSKERAIGADSPAITPPKEPEKFNVDDLQKGKPCTSLQEHDDVKGRIMDVITPEGITDEAIHGMLETNGMAGSIENTRALLAEMQHERNITYKDGIVKMS